MMIELEVKKTLHIDTTAILDKLDDDCADLEDAVYSYVDEMDNCDYYLMGEEQIQELIKLMKSFIK